MGMRDPKGAPREVRRVRAFFGVEFGATTDAAAAAASSSIIRSFARCLAHLSLPSSPIARLSGPLDRSRDSSLYLLIRLSIRLSSEEEVDLVCRSLACARRSQPTHRTCISRLIIHAINLRAHSSAHRDGYRSCAGIGIHTIDSRTRSTR